MNRSKIIILEGITTSGKTSVKNELKKIFINRKLDCVFVNEDETLLPLLNNTDPKLANNYIVDLLKKYISLNADVIIFDRLNLSHIWRTGNHIESFRESMSILLKNNSIIYFLEISNDKLEERISLAKSHRDEKWNAYVNKRGDTQDEIIKYYYNQQKELIKLLKTMPIPNVILNTNNMKFRNIAQEISLCFGNG